MSPVSPGPFPSACFSRYLLLSAGLSESGVAGGAPLQWYRAHHKPRATPLQSLGKQARGSAADHSPVPSRSPGLLGSRRLVGFFSSFSYFFFFSAMIVRFLTKRFIGDYEPNTG